MNTIVNIILFAIAAVILIIITYFVIKKNQKKKKRMHWLLTIASNAGIKIKDHDLWLHASIGYDPESRKLLYIEEPYKDNNPLVLDLDNFVKCESVSITRTVEQKTVIDKLEMRLTPKDNKNTWVALDFYNSHRYPQFIDEFVLADKWKKIITDALKK